MSSKKWCHFFINNKIIQIKDILCSSGLKSPYYCDFRMMLNFNDKLMEVVELMKSVVEEEWVKLSDESGDKIKLNRIASVPIGAVPFATLLSQTMNKPSIMVRKEAKKYGKKNVIEGYMKINDNVVIVEDVITTGESVVEAVKKVANRGGNVKLIICILDRQEGGLEFIKYHYPQLKVISLFTIGKLMNIAESDKLVEGYNVEKVRFHSETRFKNMINNIRKLNEENRQQPYQEDIYKWWSIHYLKSINPLVVGYDYNKTKNNKNENIDGNIKQKTITNLTLKGGKLYINNIILDCRCLQDWDVIYFKLKTLGKKVRNIILDFDIIKDWNKKKQSQLLELQKENGFNVIENTFKVSGWNNVLNYGYQLHHIQSNNSNMYPRNLIVNSQIMNVLVSCPEDFTLLVDDIKKMVINMGIKDKYHKAFIQLHFHPKLITKLVSNPDIWKGLRDAVVQLNNLSGFTLNGIMLDYNIFTDEILSVLKIDKKLDLGKCVPIILHTSDNFSLHPSMITNNIHKDEEAMYNKFKKVCSKLYISQWVVREDILQSNVPINKKWEMYSKLLGFSNEELNCHFRVKGGVSMYVFRDYLEEILNTPLNNINKINNDTQNNKEAELEMNNLLGKGRSKLSSMETTNNNVNNTEEDNETIVKEESPEAKQLRLKKEFNEYQISVDNCLLNIRQEQGNRWKQYDNKQKQIENNINTNKNQPIYENGFFTNILKYGVNDSVRLYWSLLKNNMGY